MAESPGPGEADQALNDLGWADLLYASPRQAAAMAFSALGTTGSAATLLDDVVTHALGLGTTPDVCVLFPAPLHANPAEPEPDDPPIFFQEDAAVLNGIVSSRIDQAFVMVLAVEGDDGPEFATLQSGFLRNLEVTGVDPAHAYRHVSIRARAEYLTPLKVEGSWESAMAAARVALAHQLIAGARRMLAEARQHALDRVQFGRPVASFQAVRHKLAESLVQIEGAASVAEACLHDPDPLFGGAGQVAGRPSRSHNRHPCPASAGRDRLHRRTPIPPLAQADAGGGCAVRLRQLAPNRDRPRSVDLRHRAPPHPTLSTRRNHGTRRLRQLCQELVGA